MKLPVRDNNRLGWLLDDGAFHSDIDLEVFGIVMPATLTPRELQRKIEAIVDSTAFHDVPKGVNVVELFPRSGPGENYAKERDHAKAQFEAEKLKILTGMARANLRGITDWGGEKILFTDIGSAGEEKLLATIRIKVSEDLPAVRISSIYEWEE